MVAAMVHMIAKHTPKPLADRIRDAQPPRIPVGGVFTPATRRGTPAVNTVRRARAAAALEYGLKGGGRQKVRFRRYMRANGSKWFQRGQS